MIPITKLSTSHKEETFMYLSIITALIAYQAGLTWMVWVFGLKASGELISSIRLAIKEILALKQEMSANNLTNKEESKNIS